MFTLQSSQFSGQLVDAGFTPQQANLLLSILGNCAAELQHRGNMSLEADPRINPATFNWTTGDSITNENVSQYYSTLRVSNYNSTYNTTNNTVEGGLTVIINGGLYVDYIIGPNGSQLPTGEVTTETVITDIEIDSNGDLELTKKTITVLKSVDAGTSLVTTASADLVTDVDWTAPELRERKRTTIKVFHAGTLAAYNNVDTAEAC